MAQVPTPLINFYLRDTKSTSRTAIYLYVSFSGTRLRCPTKLQIEPSKWSTKKQRPKLQSGLTKAINSIQDKAEKCFEDLFKQSGLPPSKGRLKDELEIKLGHKRDEKPENLFGFVSDFINTAPTRINDKGKPLSEGTIKSYRQFRDILIQFQAATRYRIDFDTIDLVFYDKFVEWLTLSKRYTPNTIGRYIKTLKTILQDATDKGYNQNLAFKNKKFKVIREATEAIYLTWDEIDELQQLELSGSKELVRDLFLVACYTGLRGSDVMRLTPDNIQQDTIKLVQQKTRDSLRVPIDPRMKPVLDKYSLPFPKLSPQFVTREIKQICKMCPLLNAEVSITRTKGGKEFTKQVPKYSLVMFHSGRRSFSTNWYKDKTPASVLMRATGHRTEQAFLTYIKTEPWEDVEIFRAIMIKQQAKLEVV